MEPVPTSGSPPSGEVIGKLPLPAGRSAGAELEAEIKTVSKSAIIDGLLEAVNGLMAVLNENRQILAINDSMLQALSVGSLEKVLGLRLGEAVHCIHAEHAPDGCGTTEFCPSCGAAIAQVAALAGNHAAEQICAIEIPGEDAHNNLFFRVRASPLVIAGQRHLLLFLQDISQEQRLAALEQVFLHDLRNTTTGISIGTALLAESTTGEDNEIACNVLHLADRLTREIELQRCLTDSAFKNFKCRLELLSLAALLEELQRSCQHHPASTNRTLEIVFPSPDRTLHSDLTILHRILYNMVINALEASPAGGVVKIAAHRDEAHEIFSVWNSGYIPPVIAQRIFQRNFSTKGSLGHGLGTYSMKLLGEKLLGGRVTFTSSPEQGTCFQLRLRP
jgi:signal transduction histidine kinase